MEPQSLKVDKEQSSDTVISDHLAIEESCNVLQAEEAYEIGKAESKLVHPKAEDSDIYILNMIIRCMNATKKTFPVTIDGVVTVDDIQKFLAKRNKQIPVERICRILYEMGVYGSLNGIYFNESVTPRISGFVFNEGGIIN